MKVSELGELGLIDRLSRIVAKTRNNQFASWEQLILGMGDDAAAWQGDGSIQLATVDSLRQDIHFTSGMASWEDLGWKALAVNISDIAAMGGLPRYALSSLAVPPDTELEDVVALYHGMIVLGQQFGVAIVGGDTDMAPYIDITIALYGNTGSRDRRLLTRSAAKPGDKVAVTGYLGAAAGGCDMLRKKRQFDAKASLALRNAFLRPFPRVEEGQLLVKQGVKAAIDVSDGLVADLDHICRASRVAARIEADLMPVHPAVVAHCGDRALELALSGGEDYELLFTASAEIVEKVQAAASCPVTIIGDIAANRVHRTTVVDTNGKPINLPKTGWEHFRK